MRAEFVFSSESVTAGHPDKLCDQVSDALVDHYLRQDPLSRVVAQCAVSTGIVFVSVKSRSTASVDVPNVTRRVIREAGYDGAGFDARTCTVMTSLHELAESVPRLDEERLSDEELDAVPAADQATVFGYACRETPSMMPMPIHLAHRIARSLADARGAGLDFLQPDGKTQVGVEYREGMPHRVHTVTVIAAQTEKEKPSQDALREAILEAVLEPVFADEPIRPDERTRIAVNPEGPVSPGGPLLHAGLTGRKTSVDTYGDYARTGGSALCGKDPSRIDRVGAYAARYVARNVVAADLAERCEVQITYAVGLSLPVSVQIETFGTARVEEDEIARRISASFDLRPAAIVRGFRLRRLAARAPGGFYRRLATYGQVGRTDLELPWEKNGLADALR